MPEPPASTTAKRRAARVTGEAERFVSAGKFTFFELQKTERAEQRPGGKSTAFTQDTVTINVPNDHFFTSARRFARIALVVVSALIVYGSLFPFRFVSPENPTSGLIELFSNWSLGHSRSDALGNLALFFPFGLLAALLARGTGATVLAHFLYIAAGGTLALACQIAQIYLPTRSAAMGDVLWNMAGLGLGMMTSRLAGSVSTPTSRFQPLVLPMVIGSLWLAAELAPMVPTLSLSSLVQNLKPLISAEFNLPDAALSAAGLFLTTALFAPALAPTLRSWTASMLVAIVVVGKIVVLGAGLGIGTCAGLLVGLLLWQFLSVYRPGEISTAAGIVLITAITLRGLAPFEFSSEPGPWHSIPFQAWLQGSLMSNVQSAAANVFLYAGLLAVIAVTGRHVLGPAVFLALWVTLLEIAQVWIVNRSGDITEPMLVLITGATLKTFLPYLPRSIAWKPMPSRRSNDDRRTSIWLAILAIVSACTVIAVGMGWVLRLPKIPYNVRELFLDDASFPARAMFGLAVLWIGAGSVLAARFVMRSRFPVLAWGVAVPGVGIVSLLLFSASVTQESIGDIAGSNNLYWFVTNRNIWGGWWREIFLAIGSPTLVAFLERPVRYTALVGPLFVFLACGWIFATQFAHREIALKRFTIIVLGAMPWLWLCKAIAFDWSSTDNLNELIARDGAWGLGGGGYLYLLIGVVAVVAIQLAVGNRLWRYRPYGLVAILLSIPVGYWLLQQGLNPSVEKYSRVFSGAQFLLGPDRTNLLSELALFGRWATFQTANITLIALSIRGASGFRFNKTCRQTDANP